MNGLVNAQRYFPTVFKGLNGEATTSVPGTYQVLFVCMSYVGGVHEFSCVSTEFVVESDLTVVPEPSILGTLIAVTVAFVIFLGFKLCHTRGKYLKIAAGL